MPSDRLDDVRISDNLHVKEQKFYTDAESRVVRLRASGKVPPCGGNFSVARRGKRLGIELHFQGSRRARVRVRAVRENGSLGRMVRRGIPSDDGLWQCRAKRGNGYAFCHATIGMSEPRGRSVSVGFYARTPENPNICLNYGDFPKKIRIFARVSTVTDDGPKSQSVRMGTGAAERMRRRKRYCEKGEGSPDPTRQDKQFY